MVRIIWQETKIVQKIKTLHVQTTPLEIQTRIEITTQQRIILETVLKTIVQTIQMITINHSLNKRDLIPFFIC